jgi:uncharacterized membrane protein (UPF0127 family)
MTMPKTMIWTRAAGLALLIAAVGCSPLAAGSNAAQAQDSAAATPSAAVHPVSGLAIVPLTVTTAKGPHVFRVEVAATAADQERGLMFRAVMGDDEGMIFPMDPPRPTAFWMKNTVIPLDIIFIGADHRILNIAANAVPYDLQPLPSTGNAAGVLELVGGRAAEIGLKPGDAVSW